MVSFFYNELFNSPEFCFRVLLPLHLAGSPPLDWLCPGPSSLQQDIGSQGISKLVPGDFSHKAEVSSQCRTSSISMLFPGAPRVAKAHDKVILSQDSRREWCPRIMIKPPEFCRPEPETAHRSSRTNPRCRIPSLGPLPSESPQAYQALLLALWGGLSEAISLRSLHRAPTKDTIQFFPSRLRPLHPQSS